MFRAEGYTPIEAIPLGDGWRVLLCVGECGGGKVMAWRFVIQPNGKYARFSEIADDFTHYDMTRDKAVNCAITEYGIDAVEAEAKVARADEAGLSRMSEALNIVRAIHGADVYDDLVLLFYDTEREESE